MRDALRAIGLGLLVLVGLVAFLSDREDRDTSIPVPPPGYEYCTIGEETGLGFCEEGR